ncbi:CCA tRNA nucleotidyltransferase [Nitratifractor salsuginis]|uniref:Polynucleotide adenylyltransferase region n=1 Tax=Nitratifractor salsuginis (strain DSM 16511 / JCM 12458 / E9I37-1) TaxID=749222 RepID=E6X1F1_NITSE|nr:CCA tRNA nucleotidyltransferase [Nitratifractor salsuginis]ADV45884.1 Polynucleotide adenylyltransferase region [Nitratifractor salsuginis DSM 16511]
MTTLRAPDFLTPFPHKLQKQIHEVEHFLSTHYSARCRIVGGAVRDRLLGRPVKDVDLEVYGLELPRFEEAMERLGASGVGKSFFVYKYGDLDIALPRRERKVAEGHRGFAVEPAFDEREATRRRDFTVNALMYDLQEGKILDYWGGLEDLEAKRLRCVDPETFVEDSLRVLRGMQFAARLGFRIEEGTCRLCRGVDLGDLPGARIFGEFGKMFGGVWLHYGLYALESMEISQKLWGQGLDRAAFFAAARKMARYPAQAPEGIRPYCFLAIYAQHSAVPIGKILDAVDAPNRYRRALERLPKLPPKVPLSFVADLARKEGVKHSPLACYPQVREAAKRLGVWESAFEIGVTPRELMARGFRGKALGEELERRRRQKIEALED